MTDSLRDRFASFGSERRRFSTAEIPGIGIVGLRSLTAKEYIRIEAAQARANLAAMQGKAEEQAKALGDVYVERVTQCVTDPADNNNPLFTAEDRKLLLALDESVSEPLYDACERHCRTAGPGAAQKNLSTTRSGDSPSESGTT